MRRLWKRMAAIYGHRWTSSFGTIGEAGFVTWSRALQDASPSRIAHALRRCIERADPWPPSLPEFRALCRPKPEELGLPGEAEAFRAACQQAPDWSQVHPIIWQVRVALGVWELTHEPADRLWPRFQTVYQTLIERALSGETFTLPEALTVPRLAHEPPSRVTAPGDARAHLQHLRELLRRPGVSPPGTVPAPADPISDQP